MAADVASKTSTMPLPAPAVADVAKNRGVAKAEPPARNTSSASRSFTDELEGRDRAAERSKSKPAKPNNASQEGKDTARAEQSSPQPKNATSGSKQADKSAQNTPATTANKDAKQSLAPLKKVAVANREAITTAPAVAFLTGQLDKLQPSSIPELLSDNPFMVTALGEADIQEFLAKPVSIGELLEALDLPNEIKDEAEKLGLDLAATVSPSDLLRAIGVDPQRVFAELKLLKDNLSLGDVSSYLKRARAMAGRDPLQDTPMPTERLGLNGGLPRAPMAPVTSMNGPTPTLAQNTSSPSPLDTVRGGKPELTPNQAAPANGLALNQDEVRGLSPDTVFMLSQAGLLSPDAMTDVAKDGMATALPSHGANSASPLNQTMMDRAATAEMPSAPTMHRASHDAWAAMNQRMQGVDVQHVDMAGRSDRLAADQHMTLEEQLLRGFGQARPSNGPMLQAATMNPALGMAEPLSKTLAQASDPRLLETMMDQDVSVRDARPSSSWMMSKPAVAVAPVPAFKDAALLSGQSMAVAADDLQLVAPIWNARELSQGADTSGGQGDGFSQERDGERESELRTHAEFSGELAKTGSTVKAGFANAVTQTDAGQLTPEQRAQLVQQVIDRATVMLKDGGGNMRLDLSSSELGQLEMAINVNEDRVDLKVMTGSDRVREILLADLGRLRDALVVQNLQLGNVDVGVGGRDPSGFASDGSFQFFQGQGRRDFGDRGREARGGRDRGGVASTVKRLDTVRHAILPHVAAAGSYNQHGRLAIRA